MKSVDANRLLESPFRRPTSSGSRGVWIALVCLMSACQCAPTVPGPDAGPAPDGGAPDAGSPDAGAVDAGPLDAGAPDAGLPDAGSLDAGSLDAGAQDAGPMDSGTPDAGPDLTPPTFEVVVMPPPRLMVPYLYYGGPNPPQWRTDEDPLVAVLWPDSDVDPSSVELFVEGLAGPGDGVTRAGSCDCDGGCACFRIDGTRLVPAASSSEGLFTLRAVGSDTSGNTGDAGNVIITERDVWLWGGKQLMPSVPALDPGGNLFVRYH